MLRIGGALERQVDISVVIPLYNKSSHIARALDSVLAQSMPPAEVVVVDDGATDGSGDIVRRYADKGIRLIVQENQGVSVARNRGVAEARADLIAFLDADDEWRPGFLSEITRMTNAFPDCGLYATAELVVGAGLKGAPPPLHGIPSEPWFGVLPSFFATFQGRTPFNPSSVAVPKAVLTEIGGFAPGMKVWEDIDCWVRIAIRHPIAFSTARLSVYHKEAENRACVRERAPTELNYVRIIHDAVREGTIAAGLRGDALEFATYSQLVVAGNNIAAGNPRYARVLLKSCRRTRRYAKVRRRLMLQAMLPPGWPARLTAFRNAARNLAGVGCRTS